MHTWRFGPVALDVITVVASLLAVTAALTMLALGIACLNNGEKKNRRRPWED